MARRSFEESVAELVRRGWLEGPVRLPDRMPRYDDEVLAVNFFRTQVEGALDDLSLPRTYFGRSLIANASFKNTELRESSMCWNDFEQVDFSGADLSVCDLRASNFVGCRFTGAKLDGADLRRSGFEGCDFTGASLRGARLTREQELALTESQRAEVAWMSDEGDEPDGG